MGCMRNLEQFKCNSMAWIQKLYMDFKSLYELALITRRLETRVLLVSSRCRASVDQTTDKV